VIGRKEHIIYLLGMLALLLTSCKEEPGYDTIYPKAYFPAYPESYWVYSNGVTKTTDAYYSLQTINGSDYYVPIYDGMVVNGYQIGNKEIINFSGSPWKVGGFFDEDVYREIINFDTAITVKLFPYIDSLYCDTIFETHNQIPIDTSINLVQVSNCDNYPFCDTVLINCDNPHFCDTLFYAYIYEIEYLDTLVVDTIITNCNSFAYYDSVIVVKEYVNSLDAQDCWFYKDYYAKNIGLVKREVASCSDSTDYITEFELIKYHIRKN